MFISLTFTKFNTDLAVYSLPFTHICTYTVTIPSFYMENNGYAFIDLITDPN